MSSSLKYTLVSRAPAKNIFILLVLLLSFCQSSFTADIFARTIFREDLESKFKEALPNSPFVEITANQVSYDDETSFYEASGNAVAYLPQKDASLKADRIVFNAKAKLIEAYGDIEIEQKNSSLHGEYISFDLNTNDYQINEPRASVNGVRLKARVMKSHFVKNNAALTKDKQEENILNFKDGILANDKPIGIFSPGYNVSTKYSQDIVRYYRFRDLDWDDYPETSSFKFSAEEITYDDTKKINNLKIKGARVWINDKLSIPSPVHITSTVGESANSKFLGPIIGTQERIGGFALGPRFYHEEEHGVYSVAPIVQIGNDADFGGGAIASFNRPGDTTAIMGGYGSLENRFILNAHQEVYRNYIQTNAFINQFKRGGIFGTSQVGQLYEVASDFRLKLPFIDRRGVRINSSFGYAKDNEELFSAERKDDLRVELERGPKADLEHDGFRFENQLDLYTLPVFRLGNEFYNFSLRGRSQTAFRFYDTGDTQFLARFGPAVEARFKNLAFEIDYLYALINGESPFLFDQFVDGNQSIVFDGDYTLNKWVSLGTKLTYNIEREELTRNQVRTEFGPQDFKMRLSYDFVRNQVNLGFNMLIGEPIKYDSLKVKI